MNMYENARAISKKPFKRQRFERSRERKKIFCTLGLIFESPSGIMHLSRALEEPALGRGQALDLELGQRVALSI